MASQLGFHVEPWRVDTLAVDVGASIQDVVEDLQAQMRLCDFVDLGECEREAQAHRCRVFAHRPALVAEIAPRLVDETQQLFVFHVHGDPSL